MLSVIRGEDWKRVRSIVTPTFTTGKIKRMLGIFKECTGTLMDNLNALVKEGKPVDLKRMYGTFAMDVIASSAFSTKIDSHNDPENKFVQMAKTVFNQELGFKLILFLVAPKLIKLLGVGVFATEASAFFKDMTLKIIEERKRTGQKRNDFLQLLMDTAKEISDEQKGESAEKEKGDIASNYELTDVEQQIFRTVTSKKLSLDELVAQSVIFFVAGYDTTASTLSFATYLLALNQDIQDRLRGEVDAALEENNASSCFPCF
ncbi:Cytochrome P450 3A2 like protein [Argiope bruennichi]|uniref:Cytochrome P450 3A2 like protein n=1 Tax=Argiope bruennichi TaxID=94029 RepID=A0A8T0G1H5_ARGBR|nr:Cytochrome P450 3A2 like protein [Argiope bruennichi]